VPLWTGCFLNLFRSGLLKDDYSSFSTHANEGIFYIRAEYPLAVARIRIAIKQCYENGILGIKYTKALFHLILKSLKEPAHLFAVKKQH